MIIAISGCSDATKSCINYNLEDDPITLDSVIATDVSATTVIQNLFEGLYIIDDEGNLEPGIAKRYESNDDYTRFTFYLRANAVYSDGITQVTANDFAFAIERILTKETDSPYAEDLYCIKNASLYNQELCNFDEVGVKVLNDYAIQIDLEYSYEKFPMLTTNTYFMPCNKAYFKSCKNMYGLESTYLITDGPFKFTSQNSWVHDESISLTRSDTYSGKNMAVPENINFYIGNSGNTSEVSAKTPDTQYISLEDYSNKKVKDNNSIYFEDTVWGIAFNLNDSIYKDEKLRLELLSSIDNDENIYGLPNNCEEADGIVPRESKLLGEPYRKEVGEADLLTYNNDSNANDSIERINSENNGEFKAATILCLDTQENIAIASNILQNFNDCTSKHYNIEPLSYDKLMKKIDNNDYQIALIPICNGTGEAYDYLSIFKSDSENNFTGLSDETFNQLLNESLSNPKSIINAENYLLQKGIFYPVYFENRCFIYEDNISHISFYPFNQGIGFRYAIKT